MTRRLLCACLGAVAFVGVLDLPARSFAKPPDLPLNDPITVTDSPPEVPTPALYQLRPTARQTLAGSMLFGVNPLLALLPTDKALDTSGDHPQKATGDDLFGDMPKHRVVHEWGGGFHVVVSEEIDWFKWLMIRLADQHPTPTPEQNEGYISTIKGASIIAGLMPVDASASESDSPAACAAEALPMPQEDKPAKKKHKKHHRKGERLPMPQEDAPAATSVDGITCPYLRQKYVDRHACQLADPEIGRDVLDNLERLKKAETLLESAERFARSGNIVEALDCCTRAQDLCPGSPCASRAATVMREVWSGAHESAADTEEAAEELPKSMRMNCLPKQGSLKKKLQQPINVDITDLPLRQVLNDFRDLLSINIYVDAPALAEKGISLDVPITIKLDDIASRSALNLILASVQLIYIIDKDDVMHITTEEHGPGKPERWVYPVADLLKHKELPKGCTCESCKAKESAERLINLLTTTIAPKTWREQGGAGAVDYFPQTQSLVVYQPRELQEQILDLLALLRRLYDQEGEKTEEPCPALTEDSSKTEPGVEQQVDGLMKACRLLMNEGLHEQAAELARQAFALDPERVMADPLLYKMHLLADTPAKHSAESSEESEPPSCPYCPPVGKPIPGIVPEKKTESGPATLLVPPLPPVDYEVVPALDRVLTETATGAEEASEDDMPSSLADLVESIMGDCDRYQFGIGADGKVQASGELAFGSSVYHVLYKRGCLAIWKTPDAAKTKP